MTVTEPEPTEATDSEAAAPGPTDEFKPDWWQRRYTFTGTAVGLLFLGLSLSPSLLPRGPLFQGLVSGAAGAVGYGLGVFAVWLVRFMLSRPASPRPPRWAWPVLVVVGIIWLVFTIYWFHVWQDHVRDLMGVPRLQWYNYPQAGLIGVVVLFLFVEIGQLIGKLVRFLVRLLNRYAPPRVSAVVVVALLLSLTIAILNGVVIRGGMSFLNRTFASVNDEMDPDNPAPTTPLRSGGPGSLVAWDTIGHQGRTFVAGGPTVQQLTTFNGAPAVEPIRAYAGKNSADGIKAVAALAARELERTGGFQRKVIAVATTTGTGWINEAEASALEYMYNGDTAIVSMQYSFLPSWLSFLVDKENARQAGQALFEAVDARLREMPEAQRPKIVVFGESLGSFGGEAPFLSPNNIIARTNGALFSGPTFNNTMWDDVTVNRDAGSPMWLPTFDEGQNIRFAARPDNLGRPDKPWGYPHVVYLQHASDPITWWNPDLLFSEPDWLREARGYDVSPDMYWIPIVTFLQVSADMAVAVDVPDGHGHRYVRDVVNAWAAILQPPGWTPEKTDRLRGIVTAPE
ncbi:alpha/beta-hydrolase family protein [Mycobacterium crocinum]|uniref:Alpha/beta-hydrolase family protein n=1 Tax=Mycolicibacterium crocinum TaxID=388459 RepID=A0ABY3TP57_9MYCO|nr:alpha/beta-hydrolase family protein [Mycolicibacterium crocinum]MCV7214492.1 alpha/beta-hydrolase family protein [Mycolicibacterium crocinum]ULN42745.1 alpha/beta-hydrolase family protein [Mycolicibacterium crocinum]